MADHQEGSNFLVTHPCVCWQNMQAGCDAICLEEGKKGEGALYPNSVLWGLILPCYWGSIHLLGTSQNGGSCSECMQSSHRWGCGLLCLLYIPVLFGLQVSHF